MSRATLNETRRDRGLPPGILEPGARRREEFSTLTRTLTVIVLVLAAWGLVVSVAWLVWLLLEVVR